MAATRKPSGYVLWGVWYDATTWKDVTVGVAANVYFHHSREFERALVLGGEARPYVSDSPDMMAEPEQIPNSPYWVETKFNQETHVMRARSLLRLFGYRDADLRVMSELHEAEDPSQTVLG